MNKQITDAINEINIWNRHLKQSLRQGKYEKMALSPYYFFRGTNHLFWKYFSEDNRINIFSNSNSDTWIQGDLHAYNYGIYGDTDGDLVYGLNDFDESCIANYQFDLWRMASSLVLIARENEFTDMDFFKHIINSFSDGYIDTLKDYNKHGKKVLRKITKKNAYGKLDETMKQVEKKDSREKMLEKWTVTENGNMKFDLSYEKLKDLPDSKKQEIEKYFEAYIQKVSQNNSFDKQYFTILDIAHRVSSGTGSFGTPRYYILIKGDANEEYGQRILDVKLQTKPSPYLFLNDKFKKNYDNKFKNEGIRHQKAYQALNYYIDKHLSWIKLSEGMFSVRERSPFKAYFQTKTLNSKERFKKLAEQWGSILSGLHIKSTDKFDANKIYKLIKNDKSRFKKLLESIAVEFADYNDNVYDVFVDKQFLSRQ